LSASARAPRPRDISGHPDSRADDSWRVRFSVFLGASRVLASAPGALGNQLASELVGGASKGRMSRSCIGAVPRFRRMFVRLGCGAGSVVWAKRDIACSVDALLADSVMDRAAPALAVAGPREWFPRSRGGKCGSVPVGDVSIRSC
jgi:hypothetical protein